MDWFEKLTGFREDGYDATRERLQVDGRLLRSKVNGREYSIGELALCPLADMRKNREVNGTQSGRLKLSIVTGDVRRLHQDPEYAGAVFQVASQFNLLEMTHYDITPEHGVTRYQSDPTQGPACAIAAGAATIYRNYFAPVAGAIGQTRYRQLDGLADVGQALSAATGMSVDALWTMRNGYALCTAAGLAKMTRHLTSLDEHGLDALRGKLRVGVHCDVEVTDAGLPDGPTVTQVFCSALPVAYGNVARPAWQAFASLVLEAAYEATLCAGAINALRSGSNIVLLTRLGGGVFGNDDGWIDRAMRRALRLAAATDLDVRLVCYGQPSLALQQLVAEWQ